MKYETIQEWYEAMKSHLCPVKNLSPQDNQMVGPIVPPGKHLIGADNPKIDIEGLMNKTELKYHPTFGYACTGCECLFEIELRKVKKPMPTFLAEYMCSSAGRQKLGEILSK